MNRDSGKGSGSALLPRESRLSKYNTESWGGETSEVLFKQLVKDMNGQIVYHFQIYEEKC